MMALVTQTNRKKMQMRQYAESIKKPAISQTGAPSITKSPRINDQAHSMSDLVRLQKAHMSSMKDIDSIRRQLNL